MQRRMRTFASIAVILSAVAVTAASPTNAAGPVVTLIGDSVADRIEHEPSALETLNTGFTLNLQTRGCRRLATPSCEMEGVATRPPSVAALARQLGPRLGRIVVVAVGYNDDPYRIDRDVDRVMRALTVEGVRHVVLLTLREARPVSALSNRRIKAEATQWPMLTVADWDAHSAAHPEWFEGDGLHLTSAGARALATFVHRTVRSTLRDVPSPA